MQNTPRETLERKIRRLRQAIAAQPSFLSDLPETAEDKRLSDELASALAELRALPQSDPVGPYSGLTRRELGATGTCETDWI